MSFVGLGFEIAVPVAVLGFVGHRADRWLATEPWLMLLGLMLGMAVSFYTLFRRVGGGTRGGGDS
jgi:F0F1-type ATP synthase assembly protein I